MLKIGETVRYGQSGLCIVQEKCEKEMAGIRQEYYVLAPFSKKGSMVFVPCDNKLLVEKATPLLTKEEIAELVKGVRECATEWIRDFRRRSEFSKKALSSADRRDPLLLIKTIYDHRNEEGTTSRVHTTDDYFLRDAENLIYSEFAYVYGVAYKEVEEKMRSLFIAEWKK